jgi:hypothetical protein
MTQLLLLVIVQQAVVILLLFRSNLALTRYSQELADALAASDRRSAPLVDVAHSRPDAHIRN